MSSGKQCSVFFPPRVTRSQGRALLGYYRPPFRGFQFAASAFAQKLRRTGRRESGGIFQLTNTVNTVFSELTEIIETMQSLTPVQQKFILHWGEMGTRWGINRTVAQIHALLFISPKPLNADDIVETLAVARSNVSTSIKELQSWGIVKMVHILGDKRDHFESMKDVWELFRVVLNERKRREIDPTIQMLDECIAEAEKSPGADAYTEQRLRDMREFLGTTSGWYGQICQLPASALVRFLKLGDKVLKTFRIGK
jgi:DNA-binding transcriptional regulator GbsR (MarR family)